MLPNYLPVGAGRFILLMGHRFGRIGFGFAPRPNKCMDLNQLILVKPSHLQFLFLHPKPNLMHVVVRVTIA